jgi:hypothetical protein
MKNSISINSSRLLFGTQGPKTTQIHTADPERDNAPNRALRSTISLTPIPRIVPHPRSSPVKRCRFNRSMQGGVYGAEETVEAFCGAEGPAVEPLEIRAVVERDWAGPRQRSCGRSIFGGALWWDCSACPPALADNHHVGRARRHLPRDCYWFVDSWDRQRSEAGGIDGEQGGRPPWRATSRSSQ